MLHWQISMGVKYIPIQDENPNALNSLFYLTCRVLWKSSWFDKMLQLACPECDVSSSYH